jgi:hypothetical protein
MRKYEILFTFLQCLDLCFDMNTKNDLWSLFRQNNKLGDNLWHSTTKNVMTKSNNTTIYIDYDAFSKLCM